MAKAPQHATLSTPQERADYAKYAAQDRGTLQKITETRAMTERTRGFGKEELISAIMTNDG